MPFLTTISLDLIYGPGSDPLRSRRPTSALLASSRIHLSCYELERSRGALHPSWGDDRPAGPTRMEDYFERVVTTLTGAC